MEIQPTALDSNGHPASSWSVIPLRGTQPSLADWRPYQTQRANEQCLRWWFAHPWDAAGVGIICGPVSHGLAVLEIADPPLAERLVLIREGLKQSHTDEKAYVASQMVVLNDRYTVLRNRLEKLYDDKLDGKITEDFYAEKRSTWSLEL